VRISEPSGFFGVFYMAGGDRRSGGWPPNRLSIPARGQTFRASAQSQIKHTPGPVDPNPA